MQFDEIGTDARYATYRLASRDRKVALRQSNSSVKLPIGDQHMNADRRIMGLAIAATAAALFTAGFTAPATAAGDVKVKCYGTNACKGKGECKTAANQCRGKNSCKGKGFEEMTETACIERHGRA